MQQQMEVCAACLVSNLQQMADKDEVFDFREYVRQNLLVQMFCGTFFVNLRGKN
jgi:hypothetical protein